MSCNGGTQDKRVSAAAHIAYHKTKKQHHLHTLKCNSIGMRFSQAEWRKMPLCAATSLFSRFKVRVFFILEPSKGLFFLLFCSFFSSSLGEKQSFPFHSCFCLFSLMIVWVFFFFDWVLFCTCPCCALRHNHGHREELQAFSCKALIKQKDKKKKKQCAYREKNNNRTSFFFRSHKTPSSVFCTPLKKKREKVLYSTESRRERRQLIKETHTERHVLNHHQQLKPENPEICDG